MHLSSLSIRFDLVPVDTPVCKHARMLRWGGGDRETEEVYENRSLKRGLLLRKASLLPRIQHAFISDVLTSGNAGAHGEFGPVPATCSFVGADQTSIRSRAARDRKWHGR